MPHIFYYRKPVYVIGAELCTWKFADFQNSLQKRGVARPFTGMENVSWKMFCNVIYFFLFLNLYQSSLTQNAYLIVLSKCSRFIGFLLVSCYNSRYIHVINSRTFQMVLSEIFLWSFFPLISRSSLLCVPSWPVVVAGRCFVEQMLSSTNLCFEITDN